MGQYGTNLAVKHEADDGISEDIMALVDHFGEILAEEFIKAMEGRGCEPPPAQPLVGLNPGAMPGKSPMGEGSVGT